jgi:ActR/RegA family two-component response regulator
VRPVVLYEDQLAPGTKPINFGIHQLALACVADLRHLERWKLKDAFSAQVCKGRDKLLRELELRRDDSGPLVAAVDHDQLYTALKLAPGACKSAILEKLHERHPSVRVVLVLENTEDLLAAARAALGLPAVKEKASPKERDQVLHALASAAAERRAEFLRSYEPFARLVNILNELLQPSSRPSS